MKILVIPDVHLKPELFDLASARLKEGAAQKAVCLMDIPDDWGQEFNISLYEKTLDRAVSFSKEHPDTLWCWGNHDTSYLWQMPETGYSKFAQFTVTYKLDRLKSGLPSLDHIAFVHRVDNVLFVHGGLTEQFVNDHVDKDKRTDADRVIRAVNKLPPEVMWEDGSPIWHRPQYESAPMYKEGILTQVVGHTPVREVSKKGSVISCDVFSTDRAGNNIGNCRLTVVDTVTGEFTLL